MKKRNISIAIALLLLIIIVTGCVTKPGGGGNNIVPIVVTFDAQGGTVDPKTKEVTVGSTYGLLPTPTKIGSIFTGWATTKTGELGIRITEDSIVTDTENHTLYARWEIPLTTKKVTVTFNRRDNKTPIPDPITVTVGSAYGTLPKLTSTWLLKFEGWFTEKVDGDKITKDTIVTIDHDHTLYAHWKPHSTTKTVTVTFDAQGGTVSPETKEATVGSTYGPLPTPIKIGSTFFTGWYTAPTGKLGIRITEDSIVTDTENHTLYARWESWKL